MECNKEQHRLAAIEVFAVPLAEALAAVAAVLLMVRVYRKKVRTLG